MSAEAVFVVLFRGVGGATQLPTAPLRKALGEAGFANVSTYINSGNAVLSSRLSESETHARIAAVAKAVSGFEKDIMLVRRKDWNRLVDGNPFPEAVDGRPRCMRSCFGICRRSTRSRPCKGGWRCGKDWWRGIDSSICMFRQASAHRNCRRSSTACSARYRRRETGEPYWRSPGSPRRLEACPESVQRFQDKDAKKQGPTA